MYKLVLKNHVDGLSACSWFFTPPAVVGREPGIALCIDHDSISRKHCQLALNAEGALLIKDLGSTNGTYVNDSRIQQAILMPGQVIQIGALLLEVDFSSAEDQQTRVKRPTTSRPQGSVYATQPMEPFKPVPLREEKSWWAKLMGR